MLDGNRGPSFDYRRGFVRIGAVSIFAIGGPVIFAGKGLESLIYYLISMALFRLLSALTVSGVAKSNPSLALVFYRASPIMIVASALTPWFSNHLFEPLILLMPILSGVYLGSYWCLHFDIDQCLNRTTEDYQFTEVVASLAGAVLGVSLSVISGTDVAVVVGGAFVLCGTFIPLGIDSQEFEAQLSDWTRESEERPREEIINGLKIVAGVAVLNWTCLSTLRIETLVGVSPILGVVSLGIALSASEAIGYWLTRDIGIENGRFKLLACFFAIFGFSLMTLGGPILAGGGYWFTSISSRVYWRVFDRKVARAALRGLGGRPGSREIRRYSISLACCPLLAYPDILPYVGIGSVILLITTRNRVSPLKKGVGVKI